MKTAEVKKILEDAGIHADKFFVRKGIFTFKRMFFYTGGNSAYKIAEKIKQALNVNIIALNVNIVEALDDWQSWPKGSYFVVKFTLK